MMVQLPGYVVIGAWVVLIVLAPVVGAVVGVATAWAWKEAEWWWKLHKIKRSERKLRKTVRQYGRKRKQNKETE